MPASHPLNQMVLLQALHEMRTGRAPRALAMGFTPAILAALKHPELVSLLFHAEIPWCKAQIDEGLVQRILKREQAYRRKDAEIEQMVRLGANNNILGSFHGLVNRDVALHRRMLELPGRKGRWHELTAEQEGPLWEAWRALRKARQVKLDDETGMMEVAKALAEKHSLVLAVVWNAINHWIREGLV